MNNIKKIEEYQLFKTVCRTNSYKLSTGTRFRVTFPRGTLLYKTYRHVPLQRVGFLRRLGLKTGIDFAHIGLESGMVFEGTTGVYERIYRFSSKWVRTRELYVLLVRNKEKYAMIRNVSYAKSFLLLL